MEKIRLGFVPAHREPFDEDWAALMRQRCLRAFSQIPDLEIVVPDGKLTRRGCVWNDSDAEKVIRLFQEKAINGLIIGTMTFGDEVAALRVATAFRNQPVYLFATREGDFTDSGGRRSDSFCGTLSISSGLHRRQIPFVFGGIAFPEEETFVENVASFVRTCNVTKGFKGANIGLVSPRPERFETCIFSEDALIRKFQQRVVPTSLPDLLGKANDSQEFKTAMPQINEQMTKEADLSAVNEETLKKIISLEYALKQFAAEKKLAAMGELDEIAERAVAGIDAVIVGDVVAVIAARRGLERHQPDRGDAEPVQIVEPAQQALEIADAVAVGVHIGADGEAIDHAVLVPEIVDHVRAASVVPPRVAAAA